MHQVKQGILLALLKCERNKARLKTVLLLKSAVKAVLTSSVAICLQGKSVGTLAPSTL